MRLYLATIRLSISNLLKEGKRWEGGKVGEGKVGRKEGGRRGVGRRRERK